jgi:hypothetical protein
MHENFRSDDNPERSPIAWFGELLLAKDRADFQRAAQAQRQLARLGWSVVFRTPRPGRQGGGQ